MREVLLGNCDVARSTRRFEVNGEPSKGKG